MSKNIIGSLGLVVAIMLLAEGMADNNFILTGIGGGILGIWHSIFTRDTY